jgi:inorganic pyrophosphatase
MNLLRIPAFASAGVFHVVVECPRGSTIKLKYEPAWEAMSVSRPLVLGMTYPYDWRFIPSTRGSDRDAIDAMVLWDVASYPSVVLPCRALAVMQVEQNGTNYDPSTRIRNDRIIASARSGPQGANRRRVHADRTPRPRGARALRGCGDRTRGQGRPHSRMGR